MDRERILKINDLIKKIKDKNILKEIFYLAQNELQSSGECNYSHNDNGIFFDLKLLSEKTLLKIEELAKSNNNTDSESINYNTYCSDDIIEHKISNIERNILIKRSNLKQ